jgi:6-phosphofructokinase 1
LFVEVMGRDSGFIALKAGIATGAVAVMTPELGMSIDDLVAVLQAGEQSNKTSSIVLVAEGDPNGGAYEIAKKVKEKTQRYETRITVLGHLQRGGAPTCFDRVLASRLGVAAVEALRGGHSAVMAGIVNDRVALTSLETAIEAKSTINEDEVRIARILSI